MNKKPNILQSLFGQISWTRPSWLNQFKIRQVKNASVALLIIILGIIAAYLWYQHLPKPLLVTAHITTPETTPIDQEPEIQLLTINFGTETSDGNFAATSVAPLNQVNQPITTGINISPSITGKWNWQGDNQISFAPDQPWHAGQTYKVTFSKTLFAKQAKMASLNYDFSTNPLYVSIAEFKFYQDPNNPNIKQAVATLNFNYPVNADSLTNHISLQQQTLNTVPNQYKFTLDYDKYKRTAYLRSETLALDTNPYYLELQIADGVKPALGNATTETITKKTLIPSRSTIFNIKNVEATIVRDPQNHSDQVLTIETSLGITTPEIIKTLHVYQLPKDYPAFNGEPAKTDYQWNNPGEVNAAILKDSKPIDLQSIPTADQFFPLHSFKFKVADGSYLYIKIDRGLRGSGDFVLDQDYNKIIKAPQFPREVNFLHDGSLLALSSEKKLSLLVRGMPAVQFEIARVLSNDINNLISQTRGKFNNPHFVNCNFNQNNISKLFTEIRQFNSDDPSAAQYTAFDLDPYLNNQASDQRLGLFLLTVLEWDQASKTSRAIKAERLILITDMGLIAKTNSDGSKDVFVQSISQGTPVSNARVIILGNNGLPVLTQTTDSQGHAHFPDLKDFILDRQPVAYVAQNGNDISFMPFEERDRGLNYSRFDIGGITQAELQNNLNAYLFSDRGIYRPGDSFHVGMIVKQSYAQAAPAGLPLEETISDPRGNTILDQKFNLPASNFTSLDFTTEPTSPTGQYTINLYTVKDGKMDNLLGTTSIQVQEFLPDRMKINAQFIPTPQAGWVSPEGLQAHVNLQNLFGTAAQNRRITGKIVLAPQALQFASYPNYIFTDPLLDPKKPPKTINETLQESHTDQQGNTTFDLNLNRFNKAIYQLTFYTEGFEAEGGRSVTTQKTVLVSPLPYLLGYQQDPDLSYLKQNLDHHLKFIAIDSQLKTIGINNLKFQLLSEQKIVTLVKKPSGIFAYQTVVQDTPVNSNLVNIAAEGLDYPLPTNTLGDYILVVTDQNGMTVSKVKFSVVGEKAIGQKPTELSVKLNKTEYMPGEQIEMQITAPYAGAGLISIERDKVHSFKWFKTTGNSTLQTIQIPADFQGNGYINIAFVRAWDSDDIFSNPLSYAVAPFTVNRAAHTVQIQLQAPSLVQPGDVLPVTYSTNQPSKIVVFAVDEGILQVANYTTPDPLDYFFRKHALDVTTQQIVDQILPNYLTKRELSAAGGDGGEQAMLKSNLNPFKRKNKLPIVFWSGILDADATPRQLSYTVPDYFNGTLRWMAVAVANNAVGSTEKTTQVRGNFVISANVPTFVAPNDTFDISVNVSNNLKNSGKNAAVNLELTTNPALQIVGNNIQTLSIDENNETVAHFQLRALNQLGDGELSFSASSDNKKNQITEDLSVRPATPYETNLLSGFSSEKNKVLSIPALRPEFFKAYAEMSVSPLILVNGLQRFLDNFPFGCTEQLVSKAFVSMTMAEQPGFIADKNLANDKIQLAVNLLRQRQMDSGGFSYWPAVGENFSMKFASIYAMQFLTEARERGYNIPSDLFNQGINYLQTLVGQDPENLDDARNSAYAIYILTRNEIVTTNYLTNLQLYLDKNYAQKWQQDIIGPYLAASYLLLKNDDAANRLITQYVFGKNSTTNSFNDFYNSVTNDAQYLAIVTRYFPNQFQKLGSNALLPLTQAILQNNYSTLSAAYSALALSTYSNQVKSFAAANQSISAILNNQTTKLLTSDNALFLRAPFANDVAQISFLSEAKPGYFYQVTQSGFAKTLADTAKQQGVEIYRVYRDTSGKTISEVPLGTEIEVHIQVRSLNKQEISNLAIIDLLPGGFEVVRDSLKPDNVDYFDAREDRVLFFLTAFPDSREIIYRIKATNKGTYTVPPILANAMYNPAVKANGVAGKISVQ